MNLHERKKVGFKLLSREFLPAFPVLLSVALYASGVHVPSRPGIMVLLAMAAVTILSLFFRQDHAFHAGLLGTMILACILLPSLADAWPLSGAVAVGIYVAIVSSSRRFRQSSGWEGWNPPRGKDLVLSVVTGFVVFAVIMAWVWLVQPDLSEQAATVPHASPGGLVLLGLAFALLNSFAEEAVFRGVFMHALKTTLGSERTALVLQAVVFGLVHVRGFPSGLAGMMIAGAVGLAFGHLRLRTRGILAPWLAHAIVNTLMWAYLAALWTGSGH
jgi:membrane protease YdiL (CAAX protease family)